MLLLGCVTSLFSFTLVAKTIPLASQVGATCMPESIMPIVAPFDMPQLQRPVFPNKSWDIRKYGARQGKLSTKVIQRCIDKASAQGGGRVLIPQGIWSTGRITLKDNVELHLEEGAELHFSGQLKDYYPAVFTRNEGIELYSLGALIYADGARNIAVTGTGKLVGPGIDCEIYEHRLDGVVIEKYIDMTSPVTDRVYDGRDTLPIFLPMFFAPMNSHNVLVEGVTFENSIFWNIVPVYCDSVIIRGVTVNSNHGRTDGIDVESSRNVLIEYTTLACGDDCFTIKSGRCEDGMRVNKPSENIVIRHCLALRGPGGLTCGSETAGWIRNVYVHDCVFDKVMNGFYFKTRRNRGGGGENIYIERIRMGNPRRAFGWDMIGSPFYMGELGERYPERALTPLTPSYRRIAVQDVTVENCETLISIKGIPESPLADMSINRLQARCGQAFKMLDVDGLVVSDSRITATDSIMSLTDCRHVMLINLKADVPGGRWVKHYEGEKCMPVLEF